MPIKTDDQSLIGKHDFEIHGLGVAPYFFAGYELRAAGCARCGRPIRQVYRIKSSDGKYFDIGCDCIRLAGEHGILQAYKQSPEYRAAQREKATTKDEKVKAEWASIMADESKRAVLNSHSHEGYYGTESWLSFALRAWGYCGMSGRAGYLRAAKKLLAA